MLGSLETIIQTDLKMIFFFINEIKQKSPHVNKKKELSKEFLYVKVGVFYIPKIRQRKQQDQAAESCLSLQKVGVCRLNVGWLYL